MRSAQTRITAGGHRWRNKGGSKSLNTASEKQRDVSFMLKIVDREWKPQNHVRIKNVESTQEVESMKDAVPVPWPFCINWTLELSITCTVLKQNSEMVQIFLKNKTRR